MIQFPRNLVRQFRNERGSAESALVIIPLLILFLCGVQLLQLTHSRNMNRLEAQDQAVKMAISSEDISLSTATPIRTLDSSELILLSRSREIRIFPFLPFIQNVFQGASRMEVTGISILERP
jgi:SET domain-containing protein